MGESKSQQNLHYGQPVVEPDFSRHNEGPWCDDCRSYECACGGRDEDDLCEFDCTRFGGWLPADDYFIPCVCNVDVRGLAV